MNDQVKIAVIASATNIAQAFAKGDGRSEDAELYSAAKAFLIAQFAVQK